MLMIFSENDLQSYCDELNQLYQTQTKLEKTSLIGFVISLLLAIQFGYDTCFDFYY